MIYRCLNCGGPLEFDTRTKRMTCELCCSFFSMEMVASQAEKEKEQIEKVEEDSCFADTTVWEQDTMECKMYHCNSCGAQLLIDEVESATYCAFCGQPTVVFQRVDKQKRPKYIIPFCVSKELALQKVRQRIDSGLFIPKEIKNVTMDRVRGIYIPYQMVNVRYHDTQVFSTVVSTKDSTQKKRFYDVEGEACFKQMTVDTSMQLNDESAMRLEPYEMIGLKEFEPAYLSGFYADCSDEDNFITKKKVERRAKKLYTEQIKEKIKKKGGHSPVLEFSNPVCEIEKMDSVLLPAWFVVFHHEGESYTLMVNGQTGKVIGAVPMDTKKAIAIFLPFSLLVSAIIAKMLTSLCDVSNGNGLQVLMFVFLLGVLAWSIACNRWKKYKHSQKLAKEVEIQQFSQKRVRDDT